MGNKMSYLIVHYCRSINKIFEHIFVNIFLPINFGIFLGAQKKHLNEMVLLSTHNIILFLLSTHKICLGQ